MSTGPKGEILQEAADISGSNGERLGSGDSGFGAIHGDAVVLGGLGCSHLFDEFTDEPTKLVLGLNEGG